MKAGACGRDLHVALLRAQRQGRLALGEAANDIDQQPARQQDRAVGLDLDVVERLGEPELHVGGLHGQLAVGRLEVDAAERRKRAAAGDGAARRAGAPRTVIRVGSRSSSCWTLHLPIWIRCINGVDKGWKLVVRPHGKRPAAVDQAWGSSGGRWREPSGPRPASPVVPRLARTLWTASAVSDPGSRRLETVRMACSTVEWSRSNSRAIWASDSVGQLAREVHRELAGPSDARGAPGREELRARDVEHGGDGVLDRGDARGASGRAGPSQLVRGARAPGRRAGVVIGSERTEDIATTRVIAPSRSADVARALARRSPRAPPGRGGRAPSARPCATEARSGCAGRAGRARP